jgi:hypothetical protein
MPRVSAVVLVICFGLLLFTQLFTLNCIVPNALNMIGGMIGGVLGGVIRGVIGGELGGVIRGVRRGLRGLYVSCTQPSVPVSCRIGCGDETDEEGEAPHFFSDGSCVEKLQVQNCVPRHTTARRSI